MRYIMATKRKSDYFGLSYIVSVILAIIPVTSWVCGFVTRFMEGKIVAGILRLVLGWAIIWLRFMPPMLNPLDMFDPLGSAFWKEGRGR